MNLNNNIFLIIIGVIGLGLSVFHVAGIAILLMSPGSRNVEHIENMTDTARWLAVFSVPMIGFGIYNIWRR